MNWNQYYMDQAGGDYNVYRGSVYQRGYGLGGSFRKFFSWIIPIVRKHALPTLESGAKAIGKEALNTVSEIAKDVAMGKNFKNASEERINLAIDNLKNKADKSLEGKGIKRRRKRYFLVKKSKKQKSDIFD